MQQWKVMQGDCNNFQTFLTATILNPYLTEFPYPINPKMCDPILVTLLKMQPHSSQSSRETATPSSGTSPLASYKEVPPPPPLGITLMRFQFKMLLKLLVNISLTNLKNSYLNKSMLPLCRCTIRPLVLHPCSSFEFPPCRSVWRC